MEQLLPFAGFTTLFLVVIGLSFMFMFWVEALFPLVSVQDKHQIKHVSSNFGLWVIAFVFADMVVGIALLNLPDHLYQIPFGLFYWLPLNSSVLLIFIGVLVVDLFSYLYHRLLHKLPWLWRIHAVHHSDTELDVSTTIRTHPAELLLGNLWLTAACILLGIPIWVNALHEIIFIPLILLQHSNTRVSEKLDKILRPVFVSPFVHKHHHSIIREQHDSNYGIGLLIWDRLLNTYQVPCSQIPQVVGVSGMQDAKWQSITGMLLAPFRYKPQRVLEPSAAPGKI